MAPCSFYKLCWYIWHNGGPQAGQGDSHLLAAAPGVKYNPVTPYVRHTGYASTPIKDQDIFSLLPPQFGWRISKDDIISSSCCANYLTVFAIPETSTVNLSCKISWGWQYHKKPTVQTTLSMQTLQAVSWYSPLLSLQHTMTNPLITDRNKVSNLLRTQNKWLCKSIIFHNHQV